MYTWLDQGLFVLRWLVILYLLHMSLWAVLKRNIPEFSYPLSYTLSLLLFGLAGWWLSILHLPIWVALLPFLITAAYAYLQGEYQFTLIRPELKWDLFFLTFFGAMLLTQIRNSSVFGHERFLDMGIIASVMRNPVVPPLDPQFAGGFLDIYYYFSHWIFGTLGIVSLVPPTIVYNLILPTVFGLSAVTCFAIGCQILPRYPYLPLLILALPRPSLLAGILISGPMDLNATLEKSVLQVIPGTANDYPLNTFLAGIPHPHVNALAFQLLLLYLLLIITLRWDELTVKGRRIILILTGCSAGGLICLNSWDAFVYYPLAAGLVLAIAYRIRVLDGGEHPGAGIFHHPDIRSIILCFCAALAVSVPYLLRMQEKAINDIGIVQNPTPLLSSLLVNGWYLIIFYLCLLPEMRKRPYIILIGCIPGIFGYGSICLFLIPLLYLVMKSDRNLFDYLAGYGLFVLIMIEMLYLGEAVDPTSRFNTVFKFGLALWPLLWVAALGMVSRYIPRPCSSDETPSRNEGIAGAVFCLLICLIFLGIPVSHGFPVVTLDGKEFLEIASPGDAQVISQLQADRTATGVVEATGDYDYHTRIASFTGVPTIIGWPSVEIQWGRNASEVEKRVHDVESFYRDPAQTLTIMDRYNCSHMVVGDFELLKYGNISISSEGLQPQILDGPTRLIVRSPQVA